MTRVTIIVDRTPLTPAQARAVRKWIQTAAYYGSPAGDCQLDDSPPRSSSEPAWVVTGPSGVDVQRTARGIRAAIEAAGELAV